IRDKIGFTHSFKTAERISKETNRIVLIGAEPDYPATGFGYIQKDGTHTNGTLVFNVDSFKEKPDYDTALNYLNSGNYLWNCGYFTASKNTFLKTMAEYAPELLKDFNKLKTAK